jgi:hypothetical protein
LLASWANAAGLADRAGRSAAMSKKAILRMIQPIHLGPAKKDILAGTRLGANSARNGMFAVGGIRQVKLEKRSALG